MQNSEKNPKPPCLLKTSFLFYMTLYFMIVRQSALVYFWALSRERRRFFALCSISIKSAAFWVRNQSGLGVKLTAGRPPAVTKTVATLFSANPAVRAMVVKKSNNKITNLRMLSPNVYVLALSFREMVPSFLSGRSVENGHNLLNFGEQGSQTRQVIYVVITLGKQSKDTRSLWMMSR